MPLFTPNMVVLQPIFYMFTRCMLRMENPLTPWNNQLKPWTYRLTLTTTTTTTRRREQRHWRPGKFSGLLRFTQWNNEWHASRSKMSPAKFAIFPHSLVRIAKELCQFFEKLVRLGVTCAAAPAPLVARQHKA